LYKIALKLTISEREWLGDGVPTFDCLGWLF